MGYSTEINEEDEDWKDVNIVTEIAVVDYHEYNYKPIEQDVQQELF